jgi:lipopolysaccharide biosynthesis glycosyltransferase
VIDVTVYMGYDPKEDLAYQVAKHTLIKNASGPVRVVPLILHKLIQSGAYRRPFHACETGHLVDDISGAKMSTEFSLSRFLVPSLADPEEGVVFFVDCDVVFFGDICKLKSELLQRSEPWTVACVKHPAYEPKTTTKMDGAVQTNYPRKNWSSFMAFNLRDESKILSNVRANAMSGSSLHRLDFAYYDVAEIAPSWNWLVGEQDQPERIDMAHFTLGGPWFENWDRKEHDEIWMEAYRDYQSDCS